MINILKIIAGIINFFHSLIESTASALGLQLTDKDLHFWVIGILGLFIWVFTGIVFRYLSKWSIKVISFIYAFTVLVVFVFAIEIEQKITGKGNMELKDILAGLWGFIVLAFAYIVFLILIWLVKRVKNNNSRRKRTKYR